MIYLRRGSDIAVLERIAGLLRYALRGWSCISADEYRALRQARERARFDRLMTQAIQPPRPTTEARRFKQCPRCRRALAFLQADGAWECSACKRRWTEQGDG